jgi:hypothetical protein
MSMIESEGCAFSQIRREEMKLHLFLVLIVFSMAITATSIFVEPSSAYELIAAWPMDEGEGEEIHDASGNGHTGEFLGNPEWDDGRFGTGIRFHGSPDHIEVPDPDHKLTPKNITLVAWINLDNITGNHSILEQYDWVGDLGTHAWRTNGAALQFYVIWGVDAPNANGGTLPVNEWVHVAATYDGENILTWIDGEVAGTAVDPQQRDLNPSDKSLSFGVRGDTKDTHWMEGVMDEVAIFDEALSQEEIQTIMNSGLQTTILDVSPLGGLSTAWGRIKNDE